MDRQSSAGGTAHDEKELSSAESNEKGRRFIQNAIELALSLGDFQKEIDSQCLPQTIIEKTVEKIGNLISFPVRAVYLVDEETSDMRLSLCSPPSATTALEEEVEFLINGGFVAWAIRERRGVTIYSKDGSSRILLHVIATYSRTRGLFIGFFPPHLKRLPDASLEILSIILRNAANGLESLAFSGLLKKQRDQLEEIVAEKTRKLLRYERQLMHAQKMEAIAALAGGIAHQFNNALFGLMGNLELSAMTLDKDSKAAEYIQRMLPIAQRMSLLTKRLLAYAQGGNYQPSTVDLCKLISDTVPAFRRKIKAGVQLELELPSERIMVKVDQTQLQMAVSAIICNADEAIEADGRIRISAGSGPCSDIQEGEAGQDTAPCAYLHIRDTGKGMDEKTRRRVFEPFFSTKFEGRGLNMAAIYGIIKNHGGWIDLKSEVGQGTCVSLYLPLSANPTKTQLAV